MAKNHQILRKTLEETFNRSELDIGGKYFVLKDFFRDIEVAYFDKVNEEILKEQEGVNRDAESVQPNQLGELSE